MCSNDKYFALEIQVTLTGIIAQQLLFLPYLVTNPTPIPFRVSHVILAATLCSLLKDKRYGLRIDKSVPSRSLTAEEKKEIARPILKQTFDPQWIASNPDRFEWWLNRMIVGR